MWNQKWRAGKGIALLVDSHLVECRSYDSIIVSSTWELTSVSMRYSQGDGVYTSLVRISYCTRIVCVSVYVSLSRFVFSCVTHGTVMCCTGR